MKIRVYATLRDIVGGPSVELPDLVETTVGEMLERLFAKYPLLRDHVMTSRGELHSAFHVLINGRDSRFLNGLETIITADDEVRIFPPVGGG